MERCLYAVAKAWLGDEVLNEYELAYIALREEPVTAYLLCDVTLKDRERLIEYLSLSEHTLAPFGGRFLAQAGLVDVLEGEWKPSSIIIAEFPSAEKAREWYSSSEYAPALAIKHLAFDRDMIVVDGLASSPVT
jgi:uncharacterized protein (DUF1330 family)